ncbi:hypothetical protein ACWEIJ_36280 [Lentzea sp. NPDC004789]
MENAAAMIDKRIDAVLLIDYHAAFDHLSAAQRAATEALRQSELNNARIAFVRLTNRPVKASASAGDKELTDEQLVALGHVGNFHYFVLQDDPKQALAEAYLCAEKFPLLAVKIFPMGIFSRDYTAALGKISERAADEQAAARTRHAEASARFRENRKRYLREMAWKAPLAGGALLAGFAAAVVFPPMASHGIQWASGIMSGTASEGLLPPRLVVIDLAAPAISELMGEIKADAAQRLAALRR